MATIPPTAPFAWISSLFANTVEVLSVPVCVYFTKRVSGSVVVADSKPITVALTPEVAPVIVLPM